MPTTTPEGLSQAQVEHFIEQGFVRLESAFGPDLARQAQDELWGAMGLLPDEPEAWTQPVIRLGWMSSPPFVAAANTPRLHSAYDALVGQGRWIRHQGLGTFPIRFPSHEAPGDDGWHVDVSFDTDDPDFMEWRVNVRSTGRALLMLFLFSDVGPEEAPTRIRAGSHATIARRLLPHGEAGLSLRQLSADGYASTNGCEELLATGKAGTVYLCHPFLVHAAQPHQGTRPRLHGAAAAPAQRRVQPSVATVAGSNCHPAGLRVDVLRKQRALASQNENDRLTCSGVDMISRQACAVLLGALRACNKALSWVLRGHGPASCR